MYIYAYTLEYMYKDTNVRMERPHMSGHASIEERLTLTTSNPGIQPIGSWARYLSLSIQAEADDEQSWNTRLTTLRRAHAYQDACVRSILLERGGGLFTHACSCCLMDFCDSKSWMICCSVADMCSAFLLPLSLCFTRRSPWSIYCFAPALFSRRSFCHCFCSGSDSLRAMAVLGCCCRSRMLCNMEACHIIKSSSMFCNSALTLRVLSMSYNAFSGSSNVGTP